MEGFLPPNIGRYGYVTSSNAESSHNTVRQQRRLPFPAAVQLSMLHISRKRNTLLKQAEALAAAYDPEKHLPWVEEINDLMTINVHVSGQTILFLL